MYVDETSDFTVIRDVDNEITVINLIDVAEEVTSRVKCDDEIREEQLEELVREYFDYEVGRICDYIVHMLGGEDLLHKVVFKEVEV